MGNSCGCFKGLFKRRLYGAVPSGNEKINNHQSLYKAPIKASSRGTFDEAFSSFESKYNLKEVIGEGSTSSCYRCIEKRTNKEFACKVIDKEKMELTFAGSLSQFETEIQVLFALQAQFQHPNIVRLEDVFITRTKIFMVMEFLKGGELFEYIVEKGTLSEEEAASILKKITSAIAYMHSKGIIHRDLKPENLLRTSKDRNAEIKIIDFGLCKVLEPSDCYAKSFLGTQGYLAPEMLQRQSYDTSVDIWALGVIAFVLLCGCLPFGDDSKKMSSSDAQAKFQLRYPPWANNLSSLAKDFLSHLLEINPEKRYSAEDALNHRWLKGEANLSKSMLQSPKHLKYVTSQQREKTNDQMKNNHSHHGRDYQKRHKPKTNKNKSPKEQKPLTQGSENDGYGTVKQVEQVKQDEESTPGRKHSL